MIMRVWRAFCDAEKGKAVPDPDASDDEGRGREGDLPVCIWLLQHDSGHKFQSRWAAVGGLQGDVFVAENCGLMMAIEILVSSECTFIDKSIQKNVQNSIPVHTKYTIIQFMHIFKYS